MPAAKGDAASPAAVAAAPAAGDGPTIESVHRDITFANQYRLELIKYLLAIAAALFAFTITFRPSLSRVDLGWAMWLGWAGLGASMIGGMFHMLGWDHYYKSYRDYDWKLRATPAEAKAEGRAARKKINGWRRIALSFQFGGFIVGVIGVGLFAAANIDNVRKPDEPASAASRQVRAPQQTPQAPPPTSR
jgi:hypothetical protein